MGCLLSSLFRLSGVKHVFFPVTMWVHVEFRWVSTPKLWPLPLTLSQKECLLLCRSDVQCFLSRCCCSWFDLKMELWSGGSLCLQINYWSWPCLEAPFKRDIKYIFINLNVQTLYTFYGTCLGQVCWFTSLSPQSFTVCIKQTCCKTWKFFSSSQKRRIMFRCGIFKPNVTHAFVFLWHYNRWNL